MDYEESVQYSSHINSFSKGLANLGLLGSSLALPALNSGQTLLPLSTHDASQDAPGALRKREALAVDVE